MNVVANEQRTGNRMKRVWIASLGVGLAIVCLCGGVFLLVYPSARRDMKLKAEAVAYTNESIKAVCENWDPKELLKRASAKLKRVASLDRMKSLASGLAKKYGPLHRIINSSPRDAKNLLSSKSAPNFRLVTRTLCEFSKGQGLVELTLYRTGKTWEIDAFFLRAPPAVIRSLTIPIGGML
jgi:hypothetical protein